MRARSNKVEESHNLNGRAVKRAFQHGAGMNSIAFDPSDPKVALSQLPHTAAVFALYGAEAHAEPYIGRTPNLRARLERLLQPSAKHPRRLQLTGRVRRIEFRLTGSELESLLLQFEMLEKVYAAKCLERMHLGAPAFIRYLGSNAYPRIVVTNRPSQREAGWAYGPFASRAAAERFADEALKLFLLRRCTCAWSVAARSKSRSVEASSRSARSVARRLSPRVAMNCSTAEDSSW